MNIKEILENNYLVDCTNCRDGHVWNRRYEGDALIEEKMICPTCKGKEKLFIGSHQLNFRHMQLNRQIPYLWSIIKHKREIPQEYHFKNYYETYVVKCDKCEGSGGKQEVNEIKDDNGQVIKRETKKVVCSNCQGEGEVIDFKTIYKNIFNEFITLKEEKKLILELINKKEWEQYIGKYEEDRPCKSDEVCVRCINYDDGNEGGLNACCGCVNESMTNTNGYSYFKPMNERAKAWYNKGGFRFNLLYDSRHNYKIK